MNKKIHIEEKKVCVELFFFIIIYFIIYINIYMCFIFDSLYL